MIRSTSSVWFGACLVACALTACSSPPGAPTREDGGREDARPPFLDGSFFCYEEDSEACVGNVHNSCVRAGEFYRVETEDCAANDMICVPDLWCIKCQPDTLGCDDNNVVRCAGDGSMWNVVEECIIEDGFVCDSGECKNLCELAVAAHSYEGCEFWAADLDNAAIGAGKDASSQQFAVVVSNPGSIPTEVVVERNDAPVGSPPVPTVVARETVLPGDLEIFRLPRREVDGSSSLAMCDSPSECTGGEVCARHCRTSTGAYLPATCNADTDCGTGERCETTGSCRVSLTASGMNDGTHSALTSNAYRVTSALPIVAYQFNPLDNAGVFSNDASLLIPSSGLDVNYTVVGWPQTIANSTNPNTDFDQTRTDEDLRAFLTIVGTQTETSMHITTGNGVVLVRAGGEIPELHSRQSFDITIGPYDVVNMETQGFNADFTGTTIAATKPVTVFVGSEASDAPRFDTLANRQCCADHLEEQLVPNSTLGTDFIIGRMPRRTQALNAAFLDPANSVGDFNEPEWVRVLAITPGTTSITTSLPDAYASFSLGEGEDIILRADQDFEMSADRPIAVLQAMSSQDAVGIPYYFPGGDPSIIVVPPIAQYRRDYVLLTPLYYGFDFITILAPNNATIQLDGEALPNTCTRSPADGIPRAPGDPDPERVVIRCQLSYPDVITMGMISRVDDGDQQDGVHTLLSDQPIGVIVYGFDNYVSYAYAGGMNLQRIN
ncbi:MAG: IgGFc-binding protein [Sandaracinaceae bacterium]|jgi:hypothetical protein|nr:IgGFc-binding protein [Sandaracinaceae bacterium]